MGDVHRARRNPCASCPYRRDVPAGIWHADEYAKLIGYDGDTSYQSPEWFGCHGDEGEHVCAGWLGHRDPADLLAVRIGLINGFLDHAVLTYRTTVPLFATGAEAAEHGMSGITAPDDRAIEAMAKILARRGRG